MHKSHNPTVDRVQLNCIWLNAFQMLVIGLCFFFLLSFFILCVQLYMTWPSRADRSYPGPVDGLLTTFSTLTTHSISRLNVCARGIDCHCTHTPSIFRIEYIHYVCTHLAGALIARTVSRNPMINFREFNCFRSANEFWSGVLGYDVWTNKGVTNANTVCSTCHPRIAAWFTLSSKWQRLGIFCYSLFSLFPTFFFISLPRFASIFFWAARTNKVKIAKYLCKLISTVGRLRCCSPANWCTDALMCMEGDFYAMSRRAFRSRCIFI